MLFLTSHAQNSSFKHTSLILWGASNSGKLELGILSLGFGLQVESGDIFGLWASSLRVSGIEGSG